MTGQLAPCSERTLGQIATSWGYQGRVHYADPTQGSPALAHGAIEAQAFRSGIRWCASDLHTDRDHTREAVLQRSLTVFVMVQGGPLHWRHGPAAMPRTGNGQMASCAVAGEANLTHRLRAGQRMRCLVIQAEPGQLQDDTLADQVDQLLRVTRFQPLPASPMWQPPATGLPVADGGLTGLVANLYRESQALALLAQGMAALTAPRRADTTLHPTDRLRLQRLCEQLRAEPLADYTLAQLARDAGLSLSALKDKFPRYAGCTVFEFLRELRLVRARQGLLEEGWSVKRAAYCAGYRHPGNFSTASRRRFGIAPSASTDD